MRDSLLAFLILTGTIGGYYYAKKAGYLTSGPVITHKSKTQAGTKAFSSEGVKNGQATNSYHDQQNQKYSDREGSPADVNEAESLPSIYEREGFTNSVKSQRSKKSQNPVQAKKNVIHGVPVQAFIQSRQNSILLPSLAREDAAGLRVFVQCMELKKRGPEYLGVKECEALLAKSTTESRSGGIQ